MSDPRDKRAKEIQEAIRVILFNDWDPIGVRSHAPRDEYDHYIDRIHRILATSPTRQSIVSELVTIERDYMGIERMTAEALYQVADKLLAIDM